MYDYFARRRFVDDTSLPSNSSNNRKILADIFGEPGKFVNELIQKEVGGIGELINK